MPVFKPRHSPVSSDPAGPIIAVPQPSPAADTNVHVQNVPVAPTEQDSNRLAPRNSLKSKEEITIQCSTTEMQWSSSINTIHKTRPKIQVRTNGFAKARRATRVRKKGYKKRVKKCRTVAKPTASGLNQTHASDRASL